MNKEKNSQNKKAGFDNFIRYSSLAFEMGLVIAAGAFGGNWLDKRVGADTPWFTIFLSLLAVVGSTYLLIKRLTNDK